MFEHIKERQDEIFERNRLLEKWGKHRTDVIAYKKVEKEKAERLEVELDQKQKGLSKLEGLSIRGLLLTVSGRKLERMDEQSQEIAQAKMKYDEALQTISDLDRELMSYNSNIEELGNPEQDMAQLQLEKRNLIKQYNTALHFELLSLTEAQSDWAIQLNELNEAIEAGKKALRALKKAGGSLHSAKGWSTWDLFGGGLMSTAFKHSHLDDAQKDIHHAQKALRHFEEELRDVNEFTNYSISIGDFLTFADYFFDGFIVDWMVHGKITDSINRVLDMEHTVKTFISKLEEQRMEASAKKDAVEIEYQSKLQSV